MKRSEINRIIRDMEQLIRQQGGALPVWGAWEPEKWKTLGPEGEEIIENQLGWDITDFGLGDFFHHGLSLFTLRNGNRKLPDKYPKPYAEKYLMLYPGQEMCEHYHWYKMEDIINRGGNDLYIRLWNGKPTDSPLSENKRNPEENEQQKLETPVTVSVDGILVTVNPGEEICLHPGQSATMLPCLYHNFRAPAEGGCVLIGEVSMCNDDANDNCFFEPVGRFPAIEEDEAPYRLLCNEYRKC